MNLLALHVYHLDEGPKADEVIALLVEAGVGTEWKIERPNDGDSNSIALPVEVDVSGKELWQVRQEKLDVAVLRMRKLRPDPIQTIRNMQLNTAMRIHTTEFYLPLSADFVIECGRLGLEICILNESVA